MIDTKIDSRANKQITILSCIFQAYEDFENGIRRTKSYIPNNKYKNYVLYAVRSTSGDKFIVKK